MPSSALHLPATIRHPFTCLLCVMLVATIITNTVAAQSLWELSPYRVHLWLALDDHGAIPLSWAPTWARQLPERVEALVGAVWQVSAEVAPQAIIDQLHQTGAPPEPASLLSDYPQLESWDKVVLVSVRWTDGTYGVQAKELDVRAQTWGPEVSRQVVEPGYLPNAVSQAVTEAFTPIGRIEHVTIGAEPTARVVPRAASLVRAPDASRYWPTPAAIEKGAALRPVLRHTDRNGQLREGGLQHVPWTYLIVDRRDVQGLECTIHSGFRQPLSPKRSARREQLALVVRPTRPESVLQLVHHSDPERPLAGCEVYARRPNSDTSQYLGRTDGRGSIHIAAAVAADASGSTQSPETGNQPTSREMSNPVWILFVKRGNRLLAKLPVVPGDKPRWVAALRDDDRRLAAEGFLVGLQESLVDLVVRREILTARINSRVQEGKLEDARRMLNDLRKLDTRDDFERRVRERQQSLVASDPTMQSQIDRLFTDSRELLQRFLDARRVYELVRKVEQSQ